MCLSHTPMSPTVRGHWDETTVPRSTGLQGQRGEWKSSGNLSGRQAGTALLRPASHPAHPQHGLKETPGPAPRLGFSGSGCCTQEPLGLMLLLSDH